MIKATATGPDGRTILIIGLSFGNLDRFRAQPGDTYIRIDGHDVGGLPIDVTIFSGETEAHCAEVIKAMIGPQTKVTVSDRLKG
jgi:hypothetical protein